VQQPPPRRVRPPPPGLICCGGEEFCEGRGMRGLITWCCIHRLRMPSGWDYGAATTK
jgi:hypothetical protein